MKNIGILAFAKIRTWEDMEKRELYFNSFIVLYMRRRRKRIAFISSDFYLCFFSKEFCFMLFKKRCFTQKYSRKFFAERNFWFTPDANANVDARISKVDDILR